MRQRKYVSDIAEYLNDLCDSKKHILDFHIISEDSVQLEFESQPEFVEDSLSANCVIALFTTAHARLALQRLLTPLGDRVLYCDTGMHDLLLSA